MLGFLSEDLLDGPPFLGWPLISLMNQGEHIIICQYKVLILQKYYYKNTILKMLNYTKNNTKYYKVLN